MKERCIPCEEAKRFGGNKLERKNLIDRLNEKYKNETTVKTVAIVKTKNGFLSHRNPGDECLTRLAVVEYISKLPGASFE